MKIILSINKAEREQLQAQLKLTGRANPESHTHHTADSPLAKLLTKVEAACKRVESKQPNNPQILQPMTWYIAEVSFWSSNPIHRCIAFHRAGGNLELHGSYEGIESHNVSSLAYFRPLRKLSEMDEDVSHFLPKEAPQIIYIEK